VGHAPISPRSLSPRSEHSRFDDPDRVGENGRENARYARRCEVVHRGQWGARAAVCLEQIFHVAVPQEIHGPADGISHQIGRKATIQSSIAPFLSDDALKNIE
jgi:hypothetical protein